MPVAFKPSHKRSGPKYQSGVGLLIFFIVLFSVAATVTLSALNNRIAARTDNNTVYPELLEAKEALLAFAMFRTSYPLLNPQDDIGPGRLPCPDTNNNGESNAACNSSTLGRLPRYYRFAPVPTPPAAAPTPEFVFTTRDDDSRFWYAVSENFRFNTPTGTLNTGSSGVLSLDGQPDDIVAVIIDAGPALGTQSRTNTNPANYLEGGNQVGGDFVTISSDSSPFNDRLIAITGEEMRTAMALRVAQEIANKIFSATTQLTAASDIEDIFTNEGPAWYGSEGWHGVIIFKQVDSDNETIFSFNALPSSCYVINGEEKTLTRSSSDCTGP